MLNIKSLIVDDIKIALKSKDKQNLQTLRMILESIKKKEIDERIVLDDAKVIAIMQKMVKQRKESIVQFTKGSRQDLADKEQQELNLINNYLPKQMSESAITAIVDSVVNTSAINSIKELGKLMAILKNELQGKADMSIVAKIAKSKLS